MTKTKNKMVQEEARSHPEQAGPNTNPRGLYQVTVQRADYWHLILHVGAPSEMEAQYIAEKMARCHWNQKKWELVDRDLYAYGVEEIKEGVSHE